MKVLHISDIHFNYKNFKSEVLRDRFLRYISENNIEVNAIVITGDSVFKYGQTEECVLFLEKLRERAKCKKEDIYICPGNHDLDRENRKRADKIYEVRENKLDITSEIYKMLVSDGYDRFNLFHKEVTDKKYIDFDVIERINDEIKYRIISLNTCLLSIDEQDEGQLRVCCSKLEELANEKYNDDYVNILIMHHGIEYLHEEEILQFQHWLSDNYIDIVMCGHSHRGGIAVLTETKYEIRQFVCGAIMLDNYAIPSFLIYDFDLKETKVDVELYTFSNDRWDLENSHLRAFRNGKFQYNLKRLQILKNRRELEKSPKMARIVSCKSKLEKLNAAELAFFNELDQKVFEVYGKKIYSRKFDSRENFSTEKILSSLLNVGMPFETTLKVVETVVNTLVSSQYRKEHFGEMTTEVIRNEVYYTICHFGFENNSNKYDISEWAGKYARKYGHNSLQLTIIDADDRRQSASIKYISDTIIRDMFFRVTGNDDCYKSLLRTEINRIALDISKFLKECSAYFLEYDVLIDFLIEIASQIPHPYIILEKRKKCILEYHEKKVRKHLNNLRCKKAEHITILETLYHSSALLVSMYSNVTGYNETSPITILHQSIAKLGMDDAKTPISKLHIVDLKKDMGNSNISWQEFVYLVYDICDSDIMKNIFVQQDNPVIPKIISFSEISLKIYCDYKNRNTLLFGKLENVLPAILSKGEGFVVKNPPKKQENCFWLSTNWTKEESLAYGLKKQILVVLTKNVEEDLSKVKKYLSEKTENCGETLWIQYDGNPFDSRYINMISEQILQIKIRPYFMEKALLEKWSTGNVRKEMFDFLTK